jgi:hypothetical protein
MALTEAFRGLITRAMGDREVDVVECDRRPLLFRVPHHSCLHDNVAEAAVRDTRTGPI